MNQIDLNREEINALIKVLLYIKFDCADIDSLLYSSSPLINSVLDKIISADGFNDSWDQVFSRLPPMYKEFAINKIERSEMQNGIKLDSVLKGEILADYLHPYKL